MIRAFAALLVPLAAGAQVVLQDFKCPTPQITPGNPTTLSCPNGHGFQPGAAPALKFWGGTGDWAQLTGMFRERLMVAVDETATTLVLNRTDRIAPPTVIRIGNEDIYCTTVVNETTVSGCTRGYNGTAPASHKYSSLARVNNGRGFYTATVVDADTLTIPVDSSGWGAPAGTIYMVWTAPATAREMTFVSTGGEGFGSTSEPADGAFLVHVPSCTDTTDRFQCMKGWLPYNTGRAKKNIAVTSYTVTAGAATLQLASYNEDPSRKLVVGRVVWISGMDDPKLNGPFVVTRVGSGNPPTDLDLDVSDTGVADGVKTGTSMNLRMTDGNYPFVWVFHPGSGSGDTNNPWRAHALKAATWNPNANRLYFTITYGKDAQRNPNGAYIGQFGTYVPGHYYHKTDPSLYAGRPMQVIVTMKPNHLVGQDSRAIHPYDPGFYGDLTSAALPSPRHYWDDMTAAYFKVSLYQEVNNYAGQTVRLGPLELREVSGEPDAFIGILTAVWDDDLHGSAGQGYELTWWGPIQQACSYEVRYSTSQSIKTLGWSKATVAQTGIAFGGGVWGGRAAQIPMAEQPQIWFGIKPYDIQIYGVSGSGQSPIWLTTRAMLGLSVGDTITVSGVGGNTAANQTNAAITDTRPWQLWRFDDGSLTGIVAAAGVCTANLSVPHNLVPGWEIQVRGSTEPALGTTQVDKFYRVSATPTATSFEFPCPGVPDGVYDTNYSKWVRLGVMAMPGIAIAGTGSGDWTGGGSLTPTGESTGFFEVMLTQSQSASPPAAPGMLRASTVTTTSVVLEWNDQATNEDSYEVERKTGTQGSYARVAVLGSNVTTYTDSGLSPDTTYLYRVRAVNVNGPSAYSNEVQVTTLPAGGIAAPSGPSADVVLNDQVRLSWGDNSTGESAYVVEVDSGAGFQDWASLPPDTTAYTVAGLSPSTAYTFRIRVTDGLTTAYSNTLAATTRATLPLRASGAPGPTAVHWIANVPDAAACQLTLRAEGQPDQTVSQQDVVRSRRLLVTGLTADTEYAYEIICGGSARHGTFRTAAAASGTTPVLFSAEAPLLAAGADNFVVDWGPDAGSLTNTVSAPCSGGRCTLQVDLGAGSVVWARRRWCGNRAGDPGCQQPGNELARSAPEPFIVP